MERETFSRDDIAYIRRRTLIFSQKWTINIVLALPRDGQEGIGFNELMKRLDGISAAVLSGRLKGLQKMGYVERRVQNGPPTRTKYALVGKAGYLIQTANRILDRRDG